MSHLRKIRVRMKKVKKNSRIKALQLKIIQNIIRLHEDSILLFKNKRYSSAYFISAIALEEIGKLFITDEFQYRANDKFSNQAELEAFLFRSIYSHTKKQKWFAKNFWGDVPTKFLTKIYKDDWETIKQKHLYVGFRKSKNKLGFNSPIDSPIKSSKKLIENQITRINDVLIHLCVGLYIESLMISYLSYKDYEKIITVDLIERLLNDWQKKGLESRKSYQNYLKEYKRVKSLSINEYIKWREYTAHNNCYAL